jgi:hypothetical protein
VFFHGSNLPDQVNPNGLPSRDLLFEFRLEKSKTNKDPVATNLRIVNAAAGYGKEGVMPKDKFEDPSNVL